MDAASWKFTAPEKAEILSDGRSFSSPVKIVKKQRLRKQLHSGSEQWRLIQTKSTDKQSVM